MVTVEEKDDKYVIEIDKNQLNDSSNDYDLGYLIRKEIWKLDDEKKQDTLADI